jgi:hypothetical protein
MPSYDAAKIRAAGETHLPEISNVLRETHRQFKETSYDWSKPFAPDDAKLWAEACRAFEGILELSAMNIDDAAKALVAIADRYQQHEDKASRELIDIFERRGGESDKHPPGH